MDVMSGYAGRMTDAEWHRTMLSKLDEWLHWDEEKLGKRSNLFAHMNMSVDDFIVWRQTSLVPKHTRILWVILDDEISERAWNSNA